MSVQPRSQELGASLCGIFRSNQEPSVVFGDTHDANDNLFVS